MSNIRNIQGGSRRHPFIDLSEESYGLLMKNQLTKSLEKIVEAENQLYKRVGKVQMKKYSIEISNMYYIKGLILDRMKDLPKSLLAYQRAFEENRNNKSICNNIGKVYLQMLNYPEAEKYLHWAIQLDDKLLQAYVNLAYLYFEIQDFDNCIMICTEAFQKNIQDYMLHEYLGICYVIRRKNYAESLVHLQQYMATCNKNKFKPSFFSLYYISYDLLVESKYEEALKYIQSAVVLYPQEKEALFLRSQIFYQLERLDEGEEDILKYAQLNNIYVNIEDSQINSHLICDEDNFGASPQISQRNHTNKEGAHLLNSEISEKEEEEEDQDQESKEQPLNEEQINKDDETNTRKESALKFKLQALQCQSDSNVEEESTQAKRNFHCQINTEQNNLILQEKLNIYFMLGLIYMKKAYLINSKKDVDHLFIQQKLQQKAVQFFKDSEEIDYQFPIIFNLGLLLEQIGENDESFQVLQRTLIVHFEKSNDETYLNSDNYHTLNLILLNIFKLNYLQRYQQNLTQILQYDESEQPKAKLSTDSKNGNSVDNTDNQNRGRYFSDVMYPRKRKISVNVIQNIKTSLNGQINRIKTIISATKEELTEIILQKLSHINKQKLLLSIEGSFKQTILDNDQSFISPNLKGGFMATTSQIGDDNLRSNIRSSYLQSCDNLNQLESLNEHQNSSYEHNSSISAGSPSSFKKNPLLECQPDVSENRLTQPDQSDTECKENNGSLNKQLSNSKQSGKQISETQAGMSLKKLSSKKCICDQENKGDAKNGDLSASTDILCNFCQEQEKKKTRENNEEEEEEEEEKNALQDEENEEVKLQKQREQEKDKIIMNAKRVFEKQKNDQYKKIQILKLEANQKQEEEFKQEKMKLFKQIKSIQQEYDNIIQQFRSLVSTNKSSTIQFFPECITCYPIYRTSDSSSRDDQASLKTQEDSKNSQLDSNLALSNQINSSQQSNHQLPADKQLTQQNLSQQQQITGSESSNCTYNCENDKKKNKTACKCVDMKNQLLSFNTFLEARQPERDFFFAFKRIMKNTFLHSRYIIDSLYRKNSITISSLAELSLGFIPLFQSDLQQLNKENSQIQIVSNEDLVKKCYTVISLSESIENLHSILDSLSSALSVYLSEYICEYSYNITENIYPDSWGNKMNQVLDLLKNSFEISFEIIGESYAYFIFYQFFSKFVESTDDLLKYKEKHVHDRAKYLFIFIINNVKFSPLEFFKAQMNPPKEIFSPTNIPPHLTRVKTNTSSSHNVSSHLNESSMKTYSNYRSESFRDDKPSNDSTPIAKRNGSKKQKRDKQQNQEKCLCNIF